MAIAKNFLKFPQAMALQLVLPLGKLVWHTSRPTTRLGRAFRYAVAAVAKARGMRWSAPKAKPAPIPAQVKAMLKLRASFQKIGQYDLHSLWTEAVKPNAYRAHIIKVREANFDHMARTVWGA